MRVSNTLKTTMAAALVVLLLPGYPIAILLSHILRWAFPRSSWPGSEREAWITWPLGAALTYSLIFWRSYS